MKPFQSTLKPALVASSLLGGATLAGAQTAPVPNARPNILLVISDDQSARFLGCYGDSQIQTPNFDRFARQGMRFDRAYVASPQCVPSRATFMTGRSPVAIGMTRFSAPLPREIVTFPEVLRASGYYTGILGRNFHLDGSRLPPESQSVFDAQKLKTFPDRVDSLEVGARAQTPAKIREFLGKVPPGKPWFLQVGYNDPHRPFEANAIPNPHDRAKLKLPAFFPDTPLVREDLGRYYDAVSRLDSDFGGVLGILEERKLDQNTLVVFIGDNGASQLRGKGTLYELGVRVPLLARWPGVIRPNSSAAGLVSGEDLAPTFLSAAGAPVPTQMTGKSLVPTLRGGSDLASRPYVFSQRGAHGSNLPFTTENFDLARVVISPTHKLIYNAMWQVPYAPVDFASGELWSDLGKRNAAGALSPIHSRFYFAPTRPIFELYDLRNDPDEMNNLAGQGASAAVETQLKAALQEWMILQRDFLPLPVPPAVYAPPVVPPPGFVMPPPVAPAPAAT